MQSGRKVSGRRMPARQRRKRFVLAPIFVVLVVTGLIASDSAAATKPRKLPRECASILLHDIESQHLSAVTTPLEPGVTNIFGIFRRPANPDDALPRALTPEDTELGSYFSQYVRQLLNRPDGERFPRPFPDYPCGVYPSNGAVIFLSR